MALIPEFTVNGLLPLGEYPASFDELRASILAQGPPGSQTWDVAWRTKLIDNGEILVRQLWEVGITDIYFDGSFVEEKDHPNDIDGYFVADAKRVASGDLERDLNALDPHKVWTWDPKQRRSHRGTTKKQLPMWHQYRVELYPHYQGLLAMQDKWGNALQFPSAFRQQRATGYRKGIVKIVR